VTSGHGAVAGEQPACSSDAGSAPAQAQRERRSNCPAGSGAASSGVRARFRFGIARCREQAREGTSPGRIGRLPSPGAGSAQAAAPGRAPGLSS